MIRTLIFDFDGLILDTESPMRASWMEIYQETGLLVSQEDWAGILGSSADPPEPYDLLDAHLERPVDRSALRERRLRRELELLSTETTMPGVRELIDAGQRRGLLLGIASSSERAWVIGLLEQHELLKEFDAIVCAEDVAKTKPSPDLYLGALAALDARADQAIAFEDSEHGVAAAKAAGIFCVAVPNSVTRCLEFEAADLVVSSLSERTLQEYLEAATR
ncbi:MAG: HAD-IA family hydrolase [Candidatus Bipolaricaulia bacterium]